MSDSSKHKPEFISIVDFKILKGQIQEPPEFSDENLKGHHFDSAIDLKFDTERKLARAELEISINSDTNKDLEATAIFVFLFIYHIQNLQDLSEVIEKGKLRVDQWLLNSLSAITFSTARGVLLTRLQGTALKRFILPVIDPSKLFKPGVMAQEIKASKAIKRK